MDFKKVKIEVNLLMIVSEGNSVDIALQDLIAHVREKPEHEQVVRKALDALRRSFMNSKFINDISMRNQPDIPKPLPLVTKTEKKSLNQDSKVTDAKDFSDELTHRCDRSFRLSDLNKIAAIIGKKYGMYPNRNVKRDKTEMFLWFKDRFDVLEEDFYACARSLNEKQ